MKKEIAVLIFCTALNNTIGSAQGCSDAGFCTIGPVNPQSVTNTTKKQKISLLFTNGVGDENVYVFTPGIQYDNQLNKHWSVQARITANYANGNLGSATGAGDIFGSAAYTFTKKKNWETALLIGVKVPLNKSNLKEQGKSLPMQYQSSLGTTDLLAGVTLASRHWQFAAAYQQPLTGINGNQFLPAYWANAKAMNYSPTNDFNRKGDVLLRAGYKITGVKKLQLNAGLLGIYHLGNDTYINGNISNKPIELQGSEGLTLNGTLAALYQINTSFSLGLSGGVPFVVRDIRPDGLTRHFVISPELIFHF